MKKIILFISVAILFLFQACYDDYKLDYNYSTTYFARQYPLRTLVDEVNKDMTFDIGVVLGGKYENKKEELVDFKLESSLLADYPDLVELPADYYSIAKTQISIPSGQFEGSVTVTIDKEKFMNDELAVGKNYALPLQIVSSTVDSILQDKDYTIIVLRYYNQYHGWYYLKGVDNKLDVNGNVIGSEVYSKTDLVSNEDMLVETVAADAVLVPYIGQFYNDQKGYTMLMKINDGVTSITGDNTSGLTNVSGTGSYDSAKRTFMLNYNYTDKDGVLHNVGDTLIFRNTELVLESWQ